MESAKLQQSTRDLIRQLKETQAEYAQFRELVERMRQMQSDYFAHRQPESLSASKQLEKQVDRAIESHQQPRLL